jgi:hypothetical protein
MFEPMRYLGIDPGINGGFAAVDDDGAAWCCPMPRTPKGVQAVFERLTEGGIRQCVAVLEHVWSSPGWGHAGAFTFGKSFGSLQAFLVAHAIPYTLVVPVKWQNAMKCRTPKARRDELGHADKNINKARAAELFERQGFKVTHAIADALLLAAYCRHVYGSRLPLDSATEDTHGKGKKARRTETGQARDRLQEEGFTW